MNNRSSVCRLHCADGSFLRFLRRFFFLRRSSCKSCVKYVGCMLRQTAKKHSYVKFENLRLPSEHCSERRRRHSDYGKVRREIMRRCKRPNRKEKKPQPPQRRLRPFSRKKTHERRKPLFPKALGVFCGAPEGIRIPDLPLRRRTLYPAVLPAHI